MLHPQEAACDVGAAQLGVYTYPLCAGPWETHARRPCPPVKNSSVSAIILCDMCAQVSLAFRAKSFGCSELGWESVRCVVQVFSSRGEAGSCMVLAVRSVLHQDWGWEWDCVSRPFLLVSCFSFIQFAEVTQMVSGLFSEGSALCVIWHVIHLQKEEISRSLLGHRLGLSLQMLKQTLVHKECSWVRTLMFTTDTIHNV